MTDTNQDMIDELSYLATLLRENGNSDVPQDCIESYLKTQSVRFYKSRPGDFWAVNAIDTARIRWGLGAPQAARDAILHALYVAENRVSTRNLN